MNAEITKLAKKVAIAESQLYSLVESLDNHMDECECDERDIHSFSNVIDLNEIHVFCLNCGGYIDVKDLEIY